MPARRTKPPERQPPTVPPETAIRLLEEHIRRGEALVKLEPVPETEYETWRTTGRDFIDKAFGRPTWHTATFVGAGSPKTVSIRMHPLDPREEAAGRVAMLVEQIKVLQGFIEQLRSEVSASGANTEVKQLQAQYSNRVFVVHGHDGGARDKIARFLERLGLEPIVLNEQPNLGRTLIEKFIDHSDVGFALVLLTPDDRGGPREEPYERQQFRARQNVLLELGFFIGRLGRERVCPLYTSGVEIPSDYEGVGFVPFDDSDGWQFQAAREMKAAGLPVDLNRLA